MSAIVSRISLGIGLVLCVGWHLDSWAQSPPPELLTTNKKPQTDARAKKKGFLGSVSEKLDVNRNGKNVLTEDGKLNSEAMPDLGLKAQKAIEERKASASNNKANKVIKNEFEGVAVTRVVTNFGAGDRETVEEFYVVRDYQDPSPYFKTYTWYDSKLQRRSTSVIKDKEKSRLLHGPYHRYVGDELVEEGFYYLGGKHSRWEAYGKDVFDTDYVLKDKQKWERGFPAEASITYYDAAKTKIKEVIPRMFGKVSGEYFAFYETGLLEAEGKFDDSLKVGRWREYHKFGSGGRLKKEIQFGKDKFEEFEPYTLREYDNKGKLLFENKEKKKVEEETEN